MQDQGQDTSRSTRREGQRWEFECGFYMIRIARDGSKLFAHRASCQNYSKCRGCLRRRAWKTGRTLETIETWRDSFWITFASGSDATRKRFDKRAERGGWKAPEGIVDAHPSWRVDFARVLDLHADRACYISSGPLDVSSRMTPRELAVRIVCARLRVPSRLSWSKGWREERTPWTNLIGYTGARDTAERAVERAALKIGRMSRGFAYQNHMGEWVLPDKLDPALKLKVAKVEFAATLKEDQRPAEQALVAEEPIAPEGTTKGLLAT